MTNTYRRTELERLQDEWMAFLLDLARKKMDIAKKARLIEDKFFEDYEKISDMNTKYVNNAAPVRSFIETAVCGAIVDDEFNLTDFAKAKDYSDLVAATKTQYEDDPKKCQRILTLIHPSTETEKSQKYLMEKLEEHRANKENYLTDEEFSHYLELREQGRVIDKADIKEYSDELIKFIRSDVPYEKSLFRESIDSLLSDEDKLEKIKHDIKADKQHSEIIAKEAFHKMRMDIINSDEELNKAFLDNFIKCQSQSKAAGLTNLGANDTGKQYSYDAILLRTSIEKRESALSLARFAQNAPLAVKKRVNINVRDVDVNYNNEELIDKYKLEELNLKDEVQKYSNQYQNNKNTLSMTEEHKKFLASTNDYIKSKKQEACDWSETQKKEETEKFEAIKEKMKNAPEDQFQQLETQYQAKLSEIDTKLEDTYNALNQFSNYINQYNPNEAIEKSQDNNDIGSKLNNLLVFDLDNPEAKKVISAFIVEPKNADSIEKLLESPNTKLAPIFKTEQRVSFIKQQLRENPAYCEKQKDHDVMERERNE